MMNLFFYFAIFIFGLIVGSFLNCVIYRLALPNFSLKNLGGLKGRSYCPYCKHILKWQDLIPVLSFLILKGKCRYCQRKISSQYPLVEITTGLLFLLIFPAFGGLPLGQDIFQFIFNSLFLILISCLLIIIFIYDLKHYIISDKVIYPAILTAFFYQLFGILNFEFVSDLGFRISDFRTLMNPILSAVLASGFFLFIVLITRGRGMGIGDIKLAFFMGLFLGFPNILVALFLAFTIGAIIGIGLILFKKKTLKSEVPFGPFLVFGTFIAFFWGQALIDWYFKLFLF